MKKDNYRWIPAILWGILLAFLSLMPGKQGGFFFFGIPHVDKVAHFGMYSVWAFLVFYAWTGNSNRGEKNIMLLTVLLGIAVGVLLEFAQYFTSLGRSLEVMDMVANGIGALTGSYVGLLRNRRRIQ